MNSSTEAGSDPPAPSCKFEEFGRSLDVGGAETVGVHPLVPLLIYSDIQFPPTTESQPIRAQADAPSSRPHRPAGAVKKPLNAFMLFMKETRAAVRQEVSERESAALNRILGTRWNALPEAEQSKYFALAQKERLLHRQLHPDWSARLNYGKKKRRPRATSKTPASD